MAIKLVIAIGAPLLEIESRAPEQSDRSEEEVCIEYKLVAKRGFVIKAEDKGNGAEENPAAAGHVVQEK